MKALLSFLVILSLASLSLSTRFAPVESSHNHAYDTSINEINSANGTSMRAGTCTYTVLVKTGTVRKAGTNSKIGMTLAGPNRWEPEVRISNLESWGGGMMDGGHDYFERGNLDAFRGTGPCLSDPICHMILTSDNSGVSSGWYVDFVEVLTINGNLDAPACSFHRFDVNQWLALDEPPYQMHAERNNCKAGADDGQGEDPLIKLNSQV